MFKATVQHCGCCDRVYRFGEWVRLEEKQMQILTASVVAGSVQILDASCKDCEEMGLAELGHA